MIRHSERSFWLPLSVYLSDHAKAIVYAADYLGGPDLASLARSVIDEIQLGCEPTSRLIATIERLLQALEARLTDATTAVGYVVEAPVEQDFVIRAEISALVHEFRYQVITSQLARNWGPAYHQRGVA